MMLRGALAAAVLACLACDAVLIVGPMASKALCVRDDAIMAEARDAVMQSEARRVSFVPLKIHSPVVDALRAELVGLALDDPRRIELGETLEAEYVRIQRSLRENAEIAHWRYVALCKPLPRPPCAVCHETVV